MSESEFRFGEKASAISRLMALAKDCAEQGWDGRAACAIDPEALRNAQAFVRALPGGFPAPECAPEPDGSISLDWIQSRHCLFSVSMGSTLQLPCAWLNRAAKGHYVASFDGASVPPRILDGIKDIICMK